MSRQAFNFTDISADCLVETGHHQLDGSQLGARVTVPPALWGKYPYNASAYAFIQQLRSAVAEFGIIEFPDLPLNPTNHTVAMRHPREHSYSDNPYLNQFCQQPHQDTPPYPTAFWLAAPRRFAATWVMKQQGLTAWSTYSQQNPAADNEAKHRVLVPQTLADGQAILLTQQPGLLLFDNSSRHNLYHARTCNFAAVAQQPDSCVDTPAYAFNEMGLLHYIDTLDSRRGNDFRDAHDLREVTEFLSREAQRQEN